MKDVYKDLIYLLTCSINSITPNKERILNMDLNSLYEISKFHSVESVVCIALEYASIKNESFHQAYKKAIRKNIMLDMDRTSIFNDFEKNKIWYMPLKGSILKEMYPENGMRQMADNDVLFDKEKQKQVKDIMMAHKYIAKSVGKSNHDVYIKEPIYNFELHTELFNESHAAPVYNYYKNVKQLLKKDTNNNLGFHFSNEDFYVYITAHEWKHYNGSGSGIRSLLDCYVYIKNKGDMLDWEYINKQTKQLEISEFEKNRRELAIKVFSSIAFPELTNNEFEMLMYYLTSGTYGTLKNNIRKKLENQSKISFLVRSVFVPRNYMNESVPFTAKSPLLYPVGIIWRSCRVIMFKRKKLKATFREVKKYEKQSI